MGPYSDEVVWDRFCAEEKIFTRRFDSAVDSSELVWHRDRENRVIYVIEGQNWKLQFDNALPVLLEKGFTYHIEKNTYHRVLKGQGDLILRIKERSEDI